MVVYCAILYVLHLPVVQLFTSLFSPHACMSFSCFNNPPSPHIFVLSFSFILKPDIDSYLYTVFKKFDTYSLQAEAINPAFGWLLIILGEWYVVLGCHYFLKHTFRDNNFVLTSGWSPVNNDIPKTSGVSMTYACAVMKNSLLHPIMPFCRCDIPIPVLHTILYLERGLSLGT